MIDQNTGDIGNASGLGCPLLADKYRGANHMPHDPRLITDESKIEALRDTIPDWIKKLQRPKTPCVTPAFGPLEGIRAVGTGQLIAQPYIGTKLAEFGAEVIHVEKPGGDVFRFTAPQLTRGPRPHGCDEAEVTKNKLSMGLDLKKARGVELLMALWRISDVDGVVGARHARTQRYHQRAGARGQPLPRDRCARVFNVRDQYNDEHYAAREMTA